jgi:hypothetical protein
MARWLEATGTVIDFKSELRSSWHPKNAVRRFVLVETDTGERIKVLPRHHDYDLLTVGDRIRFSYVPGNDDKWVDVVRLK